MSESEVGRKAESHLRHAVTLRKTIPLPVGHVEVWESATRLPSKIAPFYVRTDGGSFRVNASWKAFQRMLAASRPSLGDTKLLARLVGLGPGRRVVATNEWWVPEQYRGDHWEPRPTTEGGWEAFCVDTIKGRWERIEISNDYSVMLEDLGPGRKIGIR